MSNELPVCCLCECPTQVHLCYWACPLFDGEQIDSHCCQVDALRKDAAAKFSEKLGHPITTEDLLKTCSDCGRNHAVQDDALADQIEGNTFPPHETH